MMQIIVDTCITYYIIMHMRTTITIAEDLLKQTMKTSGKSRYSEAIVTSLKDYVSLKDRIFFLDKLFSHQLPHSFKKIKQLRRKRQWSS